ncbi:MAG: hypothetical protein FJ125_14945, partial [Deltaproteobacteria bacterium]|nr:hypothetical protein [Deltaproteobacteria bacterium]
MSAGVLRADVASGAAGSPRRQPPWRALLLASLTGSLLAVCQVNLQPLAWVALAPLTLAVVGRSGRSGAVLGFLAGLLAGSALYGMISYGLLIYGMLVVYCGVHMALFGAVVARIWGKSHPLVDLLLPALAWTAFEVLRRVGTISFPINLAGTQVDLLPLVQIASWAGSHAVSFLVALPSGLLVRWSLAGSLPRRQAAAVVILLAAATAYGGWRLHFTALPLAGVRVAGVQSAFQNWVYYLEPISDEHRQLVHRTLFALTEEAGRNGARLVLWPETALHERVLDVPALVLQLRELVHRHGFSIVTGAFRENELGLEHNSAVLFTPDGRTAAYDKRRLAGLAEWRITPGSSNHPLPTSVGPVGVMICLESIYPQDARQLTLAGAELLATTTNDAGFLFSPVAGFHGQRAILTAIESGRYLVHLSQAGPSAILDPLGRPVARLPLFQSGLVEGNVALRKELSLYHRCGDWFAVCVFAGLLFACLAPFSPKR